MEKIREDIIKIDEKIAKLVNERLKLADKIGEEKKKNNLPLVDFKVEKNVVEHFLKIASIEGLDLEFSKKLINCIISESVKIQKGEDVSRSKFLYNIFEKTKDLEKKGEKITRLDVGEPDFESPGEVKGEAADFLNSSKFIGYSSSMGMEKLREAIADDLSNKYGCDIKKQNVIITPGGKFAVFTAILAKTSLFEKVIIPEPAWPVYGDCSNLAGMRVEKIHTLMDDDWYLDPRIIEEYISAGSKLIIICSPNNPTGKIIPENNLKEICESVENHGIYIISDEVYSSYTINQFKSILQIANSNFIYIDSFSKRFGMTGWRIGYAVSDVETISKMQKLIQISVTCVPEFIQIAALKAMKMDQIYFKDFVTEMKDRIQIACNELDKIKLSYSRPDGAMYVFPRVEADGFKSSEFANDLLEDKKVSVAPGEAFGDYDKHFRISLGREKQAIQFGIQKIGEQIQGWEKRLR